MKLKNKFVNTLNIFLVLAVLFTLVSCAPIETSVAEETTQINEDILAEEALKLLEENVDNSDFILLDVRTAEEFSEEYIAGAINIDYYSETFVDEIDELDKDDIYLIYCGSGVRSGYTLEIMKELGFKEAYNIEGGIAECKEHGFEIVS